MRGEKSPARVTMRSPKLKTQIRGSPEEKTTKEEDESNLLHFTTEEPPPQPLYHFTVRAA